MKFSFILSFLSLITLVNFHGDIFAMDLPANQEIGANDAPATFTCQICFDDKPLEECCFLACGHNHYCRECLNGMLGGAFAENNLGQVRCPHTDCAQRRLAEDDVWQITQGNRELLSRYADRLALEYVNADPQAKHCPTRDCRFSFINEGNVAATYTCPGCHQTYCANCLFQHPTNTTCEAAAEARRLNNPDVAARTDAAWLAENTRDCPGCTRRIIKDGGCLHMTCHFCRHEFCWQCLGEWHSHRDYYNCNARRVTRNPNIQIPVADPAAPRVGAAAAPQPEQPAPELRQRQQQARQGEPRPYFDQYDLRQPQQTVRRNANREAATIFVLLAAAGTYFAGKYLWNKFKKPSQETPAAELPVFDEDFLNDTQAPTSPDQEWLQEQTPEVSLEDDWGF